MTDADRNEDQEKVTCWSKKLPTEPGYYWVRKREQVLHDVQGYWVLRLFHVFRDIIHHVLAVEEHGDEGWYNLDEYDNEYEWLGPLIEPPIDAEAG